MDKLAWSDPVKGVPMKNKIPQGKFTGITKHEKLKIKIYLNICGVVIVLCHWIAVPLVT